MKKKKKLKAKFDVITKKKLSTTLGEVFLRKEHKKIHDKFEQFRLNIKKNFKLSISFYSFLNLKFKKLCQIKNNKKQELFE